MENSPDIERLHIYFDFLPNLQSAMNIAIGHKFNLASEEIKFQKIVTETCGEHVYQALCRAKTEDVPLTRANLVRIHLKILNGNYPKHLISKILSNHDIYEEYAENNSSKKNPEIRGPVQISKSDVFEYFQRMIDEHRYSLNIIVTDADIFSDFLNFHIEKPACDNRQAEATRNAMVICRFLEYQRRCEPLLTLSEEKFAMCISESARMGAWAAKQVGQISLFLKFFGTAKKYSKIRSKLVTQNFHILETHKDDLFKCRSNTHFRSAGIEKAYHAEIGMADDQEGFNSKRGILYGNLALECLRRGHRTTDRIKDLDYLTVQQIISKSDEPFCNEYYDDTWEFEKTMTKVRGSINDLDFEKADIELGNAAKIMQQPRFTGPASCKIYYHRTAGLLEKAKSRNSENDYFVEARRLAIDIKNFSAVKRIEEDMGLR